MTKDDRTEPGPDDDAPRDPSGTAGAPRSDLEPGTKVEVRSTLERRWSRGFEVIEVTPRGYRVRRLTDGAELRADIAAEDVRRERKRNTWWY